VRRYLSFPIPAAVLVLGLASCGLGGGGDTLLDDDGVNPGGTQGGAIQVQVLEEFTFLTKPFADVRTNHLLRFRANFKSGGGPVLGLGPDNFLFVRDGNVSSIENAVVPTEELSKIGLSLLLDNSASIAFAPNGTPTPQNVDLLRSGAIDFVTGVASSAKRLNLYRFSVASKTERIGTYVSAGGAWLPSGTTGKTPQQDIAASINPDALADKGTALFQCVQLALEDDPDANDLFVLFTDGKEEGSKPGSKAAALAELADRPRLAFAVGVGSVDPTELAEIASTGGVLVGSTFDQVTGLFEEVGKQVQSIYTVIYDTPLQEGTYSLDFTVQQGAAKSSAHKTQFSAGVDLAQGGFHVPLIPGTTATYRDDSGSDVALLVQPINQAFIGPNTGFLHPRYLLTPAGGVSVNGPLTTHIGEGFSITSAGSTVNVLPAKLVVGATWPAPADPRFEGPLESTFVALEPIQVTAGTFPAAALVETRVVLDNTLVARRWYVRGMGLVRAIDGPTGTTVLELASAPVVAGSFD